MTFLHQSTHMLCLLGTWYSLELVRGTFVDPSIACWCRMEERCGCSMWNHEDKDANMVFSVNIRWNKRPCGSFQKLEGMTHCLRSYFASSINKFQSSQQCISLLQMHSEAATFGSSGFIVHSLAKTWTIIEKMATSALRINTNGSVD